MEMYTLGTRQHSGPASSPLTIGAIGHLKSRKSLHINGGNVKEHRWLKVVDKKVIFM